MTHVDNAPRNNRKTWERILTPLRILNSLNFDDYLGEMDGATERILIDGGCPMAGVPVESLLYVIAHLAKKKLKHFFRKWDEDGRTPNFLLNMRC